MLMTKGKPEINKLSALDVSIGTVHITDLEKISNAINVQFLPTYDTRRLLLDIEDTTFLYRGGGADMRAALRSGFKLHYFEACKDLIKYGCLLRECRVIPDGK